MTPQKRWAINNPEYFKEYRAKHPTRNDKWEKQRKETIIIEKNKPCADCGIKYNPWQMDFDHVRGQKLFNIGMTKTALEKMREEISKCDLVCANCHRQRTYERGYNVKK